MGADGTTYACSLVVASAGEEARCRIVVDTFWNAQQTRMSDKAERSQTTYDLGPVDRDTVRETQY